MGKLNLNIPEEPHKILKVYAAKHGIKLVSKAEELLIEAIKEKLMSKILEENDKSKNPHNN